METFLILFLSLVAIQIVIHVSRDIRETAIKNRIRSSVTQWAHHTVESRLLEIYGMEITLSQKEKMFQDLVKETDQMYRAAKTIDYNCKMINLQKISEMEKAISKNMYRNINSKLADNDWSLTRIIQDRDSAESKRRTEVNFL